MSRALNKLSAKAVEKAVTNGTYSDGGGLSLVVKPDRRAWQFRFTWQGKERYMGLGSANAVTLAQARLKATEARQMVSAGSDPISSKEAARAVPTFGEVAEEHIAAMEPTWRNQKHIDQWKMTLREYGKSLYPKNVDQISTDDVEAVLKPIWLSKNETATRLRGRIETVIARATAKGYRTGPNPAQWRNHLDQILPKTNKLSRGHHKALPYVRMPEFVAVLRQNTSVSNLALEFLILTAARTGEVIGAKWDEVDLETAIWTVPGSRMKAKREHRVPLTARAVEILNAIKPFRNGDFVFPGRKKGVGLSNMALEAVLRRMNLKDLATVHGFRSSFRDWVSEETDHAGEIAEISLAHIVGNETVRSYKRGDIIEKRRKLMNDWEHYANGWSLQK
jgi:integrase